ncbi:hypothetical protein PENTCL1PPCAC_13386, partial [Pristionchus entomophagus]
RTHYTRSEISKEKSIRPLMFGIVDSLYLTLLHLSNNSPAPFLELKEEPIDDSESSYDPMISNHYPLSPVKEEPIEIYETIHNDHQISGSDFIGDDYYIKEKNMPSHYLNFGMDEVGLAEENALFESMRDGTVNEAAGGSISALNEPTLTEDRESIGALSAVDFKHHEVVQHNLLPPDRLGISGFSLNKVTVALRLSRTEAGRLRQMQGQPFYLPIEETVSAHVSSTNVKPKKRGRPPKILAKDKACNGDHEPTTKNTKNVS